MLKASVLPLSLLVVLGSRAPGRSGEPAGARAFADPAKGELVIELAPVDLPAGASHHDLTQPPVAMLTLPVGGSVYGFRTEIVDAAGKLLPAELIHHFNLIDPDHRELFLPISRRMIAAGKETGARRIPRFLFGFPVQRGQRVVASAMVENLTATIYQQARVRLVMLYTPEGRPWPLFHVAPWQMDVAFPVGDKSFDLPPGRSSRSYEGRPAIPGTIVGLGGHVHTYAQRIEFTDVATGEVIYRGAPVTGSAGQVVSVPVSLLYGWTGLGVHIVPDHKYRVTVYYDNPTGDVLPDGGMGVVGGLFVPDRGAPWPAADPADSLYQQDLRHAMRLVGGHAMTMREHQAQHHHR